MIRCQIMSDLHLERFKDYGSSFIASLRDDIADVCILAGDILSYKRGIDPLYEFSAKFKQVLFVPGNHEYYGISGPGTTDEMRRDIITNLSNVHLLSDDSIQIDGITFHGCTLWYEKHFDSKTLMSVFGDMSITDILPWAHKRNERSRLYLQSHVRSGDVVITHHAPSSKSITDRWKGDPYNIFFVSDQEDIIIEKKPQLWIHGHMHQNLSYSIGQTRVECNPRGYLRHTDLGLDIENPNFDKFLVIDVKNKEEIEAEKT